MEDHEERRQKVAVHLMLTFGAIAKILERLPIPIALPTAIGTEFKGTEAIRGLTRTLDLIPDLPLDWETRQLLRQMILDWLTAFTLGALDTHQPTGWHLECVEYAIGRVQAQAELVIEALDLDMG